MARGTVASLPFWSQQYYFIADPVPAVVGPRSRKAKGYQADLVAHGLYVFKSRVVMSETAMFLYSAREDAQFADEHYPVPKPIEWDSMDGVCRTWRLVGTLY